MDMSEKANVTFGGPVTVKMPIYMKSLRKWLSPGLLWSRVYPSLQ